MSIENKDLLNDQAILAELGAYLAAQRLAANLTQAQLAEQAGVSKRTLERAEAGESIQLITFIRILRELDLLPLLEQWLPTQQASPMQQLAERKGKYSVNQKQRVRKSKTAKSNWQWGDDAWPRWRKCVYGVELSVRLY